ncbi:MAG: hypothetical protein LBF26_02065 [Puniceicoccales bacterium]|jgi:hypothetical protein|nr:hypothetical protein [Puniceicoccales bacterium]
MKNITSGQFWEPLLSNWKNPAEIDSVARDALDVTQSLAVTFGTVLTRALGIRPNGDGAIVQSVATFLTTPGGRELLKSHMRLVSNHLQIIYSEYDSIDQPEATANFIVSGTTPVANAPEQNELQLELPEQCRVGNRGEVQRRLDEFSALLRQRGFVAYKDSHILLNPKTHFAVAMIYDETLEKICLHIRDTASDDFWEKGSWFNWVADIGQGLGLMPDVYVDGDLFVRGCVEIFRPENLQITGYSMGGGIGIFAGARNSVPAVVFNPAFVSPHHTRFLPPGWNDFAREHIQVLSVSNDILSQCLDNPETGGIFPTKLFEGARVYTTDPADNPFRGHYLSELLFGLMRVAMQDPELCECAWQTLRELPRGAQEAFIRQNVPLFARFLQVGMLAALTAPGRLAAPHQSA